MAGLLPALLFLLFSYTWFRRNQSPVCRWHFVQMTGLIVDGCGLTFVVAWLQDVEPSYVYGATGALTIAVVAVGVMAAGVRRQLAFVYAVPLGLLVVSLFMFTDQSIREIALVGNAALIGITLVILGWVHEHLAQSEFSMRWLAEQQRVELKEHAEQLQAVNRDLEHFAGVTSHELQQPLVTVNWWLGLACAQLSERDQLVGQVETYLRNAESTVSNMNGLIARLLAYSGLDEDELLRESVDLNTVFTQVVDDLGALIAESDAAVTADRLPQVEADRYLLGEVLQNLVENAIKYAHPDRRPEVHVSAAERPHGWRVMVKDNGPGIDPERIDTIFAPRTRLRAGDSVRGTGLGLATCRKIVNLHRGTIGAMPGHPGSIFWFTLPKS
jgi:signal transduction histidine kinase